MGGEHSKSSNSRSPSTSLLLVQFSPFSAKSPVEEDKYRGLCLKNGKIGYWEFLILKWRIWNVHTNGQRDQSQSPLNFEYI